jgi:hypothetical protein
MTDRELMQMALRFFDWFYSSDHSVGREDFRATQQALRDRLAQPEREWVGLTDEEIDTAVKSCNTVDTYKYFRAIEAKLKEKNT